MGLCASSEATNGGNNGNAPENKGSTTTNTTTTNTQVKPVEVENTQPKPVKTNNLVQDTSNDVRVGDSGKPPPQQQQQRQPSNTSQNSKSDRDHELLLELEKEVFALYTRYLVDGATGLDVGYFLDFLHDLFQAMGIEREEEAIFVAKEFDKMFKEGDENDDQMMAWEEFWQPSIRLYIPPSELDAEIIREQLLVHEVSLSARKEDSNDEDRTDNNMLKAMATEVRQLFDLYANLLDRRGLNFSQFLDFIHEIHQAMGIERDREESFVNEFTKMFDIADDNQDKIVSWDEFWRPNIRVCIIDSELSEDIVRKQWQEFIEFKRNEMDEARDDNVVLVAVQDEVKDMFELYANADGKLDKDDFLSFLHELFQAMAIEEREEKNFVDVVYEQMFKHADSNQDRMIQWDEFWRPSIRVYVPDSELDANFVREQLKGQFVETSEKRGASSEPAKDDE